MANTEQKFNPNFSRELDIEAMISAPLVAASKANGVMVTGQTRFLLEYCFTKGDDNVYKPIMIVMSMTKGFLDNNEDSDGAVSIKTADISFSMPLICIIPLNSLAVDKVSIDFDFEVTSVISKDTKTANETNNKITNNKAILNGKIGNPSLNNGQDNNGNNSYNKRATNNIKISLNAGSLPLANGVLTILDLYTKAIQPISTSNNSIEE